MTLPEVCVSLAGGQALKARRLTWGPEEFIFCEDGDWVYRNGQMRLLFSPTGVPMLNMGCVVCTLAKDDLDGADWVTG